MRLPGILVLFCAAILASAALGQPAALSQPAPITPADLEGASVDARVIMAQVIQREGREFPVQLHQKIKVTFLANDIIDWSLSPVSETPRGRRAGPTRKGRVALGVPNETKSLGGGNFVWFFEDATLTLIRTYGGAGGYKRTIAFERKGDNVVCNARETFMREQGVGRISLRSTIDDTPIVVVSAKMASSTCKVTLKKPTPG